MNNKKKFVKIKSVPVDPETITAPIRAEDFLKRAMAYYARRMFPKASNDIQQAVQIDSQSVDAWYALGLISKASGDKGQAEQAFRKVIDLLDNTPQENLVTAHMLRRLALGEINFLTKGDWDLEKEIWQRI